MIRCWAQNTSTKTTLNFHIWLIKPASCQLLYPFQYMCISTQKQISYSAGCMVGLEPTTSGTTIQRSDQLNYTHHMAKAGFEPASLAYEANKDPLLYFANRNDMI